LGFSGPAMQFRLYDFSQVNNHVLQCTNVVRDTTRAFRCVDAHSFVSLAPFRVLKLNMPHHKPLHSDHLSNLCSISWLRIRFNRCPYPGRMASLLTRHPVPPQQVLSDQPLFQQKETGLLESSCDCPLKWSGTVCVFRFCPCALIGQKKLHSLYTFLIVFVLK